MTSLVDLSHVFEDGMPGFRMEEAGGTTVSLEFPRAPPSKDS